MEGMLGWAIGITDRFCCFIVVVVVVAIFVVVVLYFFAIAVFSYYSSYDSCCSFEKCRCYY